MALIQAVLCRKVCVTACQYTVLVPLPPSSPATELVAEPVGKLASEDCRHGASLGVRSVLKAFQSRNLHTWWSTRELQA